LRALASGCLSICFGEQYEFIFHSSHDAPLSFLVTVPSMADAAGYILGICKEADKNDDFRSSNP